MTDKHIRSMIDEIFREMKMSPENLALRDELMANALARYEDSMAQGRTQEEAFAEVAASLEDVHVLLEEMNGAQEAQEEAAQEEAAQEKESSGQKPDPKIEVRINATDELFEDEEHVDDEDEHEDDEDEHEDDADEDMPGECGAQTEINLGDALNRAFSALGDFGQAIMPEAKKLVRQMDDATGGMIGSFGRAAKKGMRDAQKTAGDVIDRMSSDAGEIVIDLGKPAGAKQDGQAQEETAAQLRREADDLRAQAQIKRAVGDQESADEMLARADELQTRADALEQAEAIAAAQADAAQEEACDAADYYGADGEVNEDAFARAVDDMTREAEEAVRQASDAVRAAGESFEKTGEEIKKTVNGGPDVFVSGEKTFPVAGLRKVDIQLDADDVCIEPTSGSDVVVCWKGRGGDPDVRMEQHKLIIRRKNPDVFKTFFSIFKKDGGRFVVRVPLGYAADYAVSTTSGDIRLSGVDVDDVKLGTTSGDMRIEPDLTVRAQKIAAETVSGDVTISACCEEAAVSGVSGDQFISCDASKVSVNSVSGDVHVEGACDEWEIETVSSDVELLCTVAPTKKMDISSVNASVRVALPGDIRGFVAEMSSVNGHIENEFGPNRYGTCALPIRMDSVNGQLVITRL